MRLRLFGLAWTKLFVSSTFHNKSSTTNTSTRTRQYSVVGGMKMMTKMSPLPDVLDHLRHAKGDVFLLDGGTGEEIFRRGVPDDRKIWSATTLVNEEYHNILGQVHTDFLRAGSQAVTTNSYGIVPGVGFGILERTKYIDLAGKIARRAVMDNNNEGYVLGSLGPLIESYRPDLIKEHKEGVEDYTIACTALDPYVDAYIIETMSCLEEVMQAIEAISTTMTRTTTTTTETKAKTSPKKPTLVSFTLNSNGGFRYDQDLVEGLLTLLETTKEKIDLAAILFNCAEPESITMALETIKSHNGLTQLLNDRGVLLGAYANRLTPVDPDWTLADSDAPQPLRNDLSEERYWNDFIKIWIEQLNVQVVGGCCGITPEHIQYIHDELQKRGTSVTRQAPSS